ncbi:hypothetical protein GGR54DRAFT_588970 [Hypoxylon sp. NC1633]|nr:hypothetical protein GGR54DRAFT_588970 [Hypoxylon sp. NC1633]
MDGQPASGPGNSLEGILNFSPHPPPLGTEQRNQARHRFHDICQHFDGGIPVDTYSRPRLIRYTYEHLLSEESRDYFLRLFFKIIDIPIDGNEFDVSEARESGPTT